MFTRKPKLGLIALAFAALAVSSPAEPIRIGIDCATTLVHRPSPLNYGTCINYLIDSDSYDPKRPVKFRDSLKKLGVKAIRWNEGEIGDKMIWAIPPFETPDAHATHLRLPGTPHYNWRVDENGKMERPMELNQAIAIARDLKLELFIIVGIDAIWVEDPTVRAVDTSGLADEEGEITKRMTDFAWATEGQTAREMIIAGTVGLARYLAKEANDIEVFLEIGNENYLGEANWKPECYAEIVNLLSAKIKEVNPRLHVGAQLANQYRWTSVSANERGWNEVLRDGLDLALLDHLVVHQYGYKDTLNLDSAIAFLDSLPAADRARLEITVTELGTWHVPRTKDRWGPNDLQRSLYLLRWLGTIQTNGKGKIRTPLFWTTRWLDALKKGAYEKSFHALNLKGELTPAGMAIHMWNRFVHESLVEITCSPAPDDLYCYASQSLSAPHQLTIWVANNSDAPSDISLNIENLADARLTGLFQYAGTGPDDFHPKLTAIEPTSLNESNPPSLDCQLAPYSVQILQFEGK